MVRRLSMLLCAAVVVATRSSAVPAPAGFDSRTVPLPPLSLHGQAQQSLSDQLQQRLNVARPLPVLRRRNTPLDRMPIARGQDIDAKMVHEPDPRYDYKLIVVPEGKN